MYVKPTGEAFTFRLMYAHKSCRSNAIPVSQLNIHIYYVDVFAVYVNTHTVIYPSTRVLESSYFKVQCVLKTVQYLSGASETLIKYYSIILGGISMSPLVACLIYGSPYMRSNILAVSLKNITNIN